MKCLKFTSERGNDWSGNRPVDTFVGNFKFVTTHFMGHCLKPPIK